MSHFLYLGQSKLSFEIHFLVLKPLIFFRIVGSWLLPVHPFSRGLWIGVFICFVLEMLSISFVQYQEILRAAPDRMSNSISFGIMSTYQIYCSQGITNSVSRTPKRIIFCFCFIIDLVISSAYSGGLATILTLPSFSDVADTIQKMVQFGLDWGDITDLWLLSLISYEDVNMLISVLHYIKLTD